MDVQNEIKKLREQTGMNRKQFCEYFEIPYRTVTEWERGTGETIGCGTGCCTAVVAGVLTGRLDRKVTVEQIGGPLYIEWEEESGHMFMTGPSHTVFESEIDASHIIGTAE